MQIYLDCGGVLADFDKAAAEVLGTGLREYEHRHGLAKFWKALARTPDFFARIPLMPDAVELFEGVRHLDPMILTAHPRV